MIMAELENNEILEPDKLKKLFKEILHICLWSVYWWLLIVALRDDFIVFKGKCNSKPPIFTTHLL
jgi:hypothetical protein